MKRRNGAKAGNEGNRDAADGYALEMFAILLDAARNAGEGQRAQARWLNEQGYLTRWGKSWTHVAVMRLKGRLKTLAKTGRLPND